MQKHVITIKVRIIFYPGAEILENLSVKMASWWACAVGNVLIGVWSGELGLSPLDTSQHRTCRQITAEHILQIVFAAQIVLWEQNIFYHFPRQDSTTI